MQKQIKNQPIKHLHYHYHYNYPSDSHLSPQKNINETLSRSVIYERRREDSFELSPESAKAKMENQGNQTFASQKWAKMRMSEIVKNKVLDGEGFHNDFSNIRAKSVVEQELLQNEQERENSKSTLLTELTKQRVTGNYRESVQTSLVAYYEQQIKKYRSEVERLKMVQEECVYLRDRFYNHYDTNCPETK